MEVGVLNMFRGLLVLGFGSIFGEGGSLSKFIIFEVGDGSQIRFCHDIWCGDQPVKEAFHELFCIARNKKAWVSDNM